MDIRQILNTPHDVPTQASSSISHVTTPFTKRSEAPSSSEGSADITKRQQASSSPAVYLVFTKRSGKHMDTEVETHGIYTCLETAINRASRKVEDGYYGECFVRRPYGGYAFFASQKTEQYVDKEIWVEAHVLNDTIEDPDDE